jgi:hypothetical protein
MNKTINDMVREVEEGEGEKVYTVWIGGVEATDYLVTLKKAEDIKYELEQEDGYTDVAIVRYATDKCGCEPGTFACSENHAKLMSERESQE